MKTIKQTEQGIYVQPECELILAGLQPLMVTSNGTEELDEEDFGWGR